MTHVLAAIEEEASAHVVLALAQTIGDLVGAPEEAVDVARGGDGADALRDRVAHADVAAVVIAARRLNGDPIGPVTRELITSLSVPVAVVATGTTSTRLKRLLVPLEGAADTAEETRGFIERAAASGTRALFLHVRDDRRLPRFTDQPHHEFESWADEFLRRFSPITARAASLEVRVGRCEDHVRRVADESRADAIVLQWRRRLDAGHGAVVSAALARDQGSVILFPVRERAA